MNKNEKLEIISDSLLLIKQLSGQYNIKNLILKDLHNNAHELLEKISISSHRKFKHVLREHNKIADQLANIGIDKKHGITEKIKKIIPAFDNI